MTARFSSTRPRARPAGCLVATALILAPAFIAGCGSSTKATGAVPTTAARRATTSSTAPGPQVVRVTLTSNGVEKKTQPGPISRFTMSPLGNGTERETIVTEKSGVNSDTAVLTFADGSTFRERYQWTLVKGTGPNPPNPGSKNWFKAVDVITGGTGRFAAASGTLTGTGTSLITAYDAAADMVTKHTEGSLKGVVTIPHAS